MRINLVSVGNELLYGERVNTNSAYLSKSLTENGYKVFSHAVLPDDPKLLK